MRTKNLASALFTKTRLHVLRELILSKRNWIHLREIARRGKLSVSGVRTELKNLEDAGIVLSEKSGNQLLYMINPECPLYPEIRMMIIKTFSLDDEIRKRLKSIKTIKFAYIFGSFASGDFDSKSDVDLMIVGNVDPQKIMSKLMDYERVLDREINTKVYSLSEYNAQLKIKNSFIHQVHNGSRIDVIGGNDES